MTPFSNHEINNRLNFIKLKSFITEHFEKVNYSFTIQDKYILDCLLRNDFTYSVVADDKVLDANLRVIDTYLPEYIALICHYNNNNSSLKSSIINVGSNNFLNGSYEWQRLFLKQKISHLLTAILFADFSDNVYNGKWHVDRCYVVKINSALKYFTIYNQTELSDLLLNLLFLSITKSSSDFFRLKLSFK